MRKKLIFFGYILFTLGIAIYSVLKADYNWDVLPYTGCVFSLENKDVNVIHKSTYELFKNSVNEKTYLLQTSGNKYRETMAICAECFYQTLPFYKIKSLYVILIYCLYKLGFNLFISPIIISSLFYFLMSLVTYLWLRKFIENEIYSFLLSALLSVTPFLINSSSNATPDLLSGFIVFFAVFNLLSRKNFYLFSLLMILSVTARPDNIFLFAILTGVLISCNEFSQYRKSMYISISIGVLILVIINIWSGNYGYSTLFYHSFVERLTNPAEFNFIINPLIYFKGLLNWLFTFKYSMIALQFVILLITLYIKFYSVYEFKKNLESLILIALGTSIIIHYIIFPLMDDRFFIAQYVVINILFIKSVYEQMDKHKTVLS